MYKGNIKWLKIIINNNNKDYLKDGQFREEEFFCELGDSFRVFQSVRWRGGFCCREKYMLI